MKLEDLEIDGIYTNRYWSNIYKCVYKASNWALMIIYSTNHRNAIVEFWEEGNDKLERAEKVDDGWLSSYNSIFNKELVFQNNETLILDDLK